MIRASYADEAPTGARHRALRGYGRCLVGARFDASSDFGWIADLIARLGPGGDIENPEHITALVARDPLSRQILAKNLPGASIHVFDPKLAVRPVLARAVTADAGRAILTPSRGLDDVVFADQLAVASSCVPLIEKMLGIAITHSLDFDPPARRIVPRPRILDPCMRARERSELLLRFQIAMESALDPDLVPSLFRDRSPMERIPWWEVRMVRLKAALESTTIFDHGSSGPLAIANMSRTEMASVLRPHFGEPIVEAPLADAESATPGITATHLATCRALDVFTQVYDDTRSVDKSAEALACEFSRVFLNGIRVRSLRELIAV